MADIELTPFPFEAHVRVALIPASVGVADIDSPTTGELDDGDTFDASCWLDVSGLQWGANSAKVDARILCSPVAGDTIGSTKFDVTLKGIKDQDTATGDDFWKLVSNGASFHLVARYGPDVNQAWAAGDEVVIAKIQFGFKTVDNSAADTTVTFSVPTAVNDYRPDSIVAAGS